MTPANGPGERGPLSSCLTGVEGGGSTGVGSATSSAGGDFDFRIPARGALERGALMTGILPVGVAGLVGRSGATGAELALGELTPEFEPPVGPER